MSMEHGSTPTAAAAALRPSGLIESLHALRAAADPAYGQRPPTTARPSAPATTLVHALAVAEHELAEARSRTHELGRALVDGLHATGLGHAVLLQLDLPPAARAIVLQQARTLRSLIEHANSLVAAPGQRAAPDAPREAMASGTRSTPSPAAGRTVLVLDDDPAVRLATRLLLETCDCDARVAEDRASALASVTAEQPDVVVADWKLGPRDTGGDVLAAIRAACGREVPAVIVYGDLVPPPVPARCIVLAKPFAAEALFAAIARACEAEFSAACPAP